MAHVLSASNIHTFPYSYTEDSEIMDLLNKYLNPQTTRPNNAGDLKFTLPAPFFRDLESKLVTGQESSTLVALHSTATTDTITAKMELTLSVDLSYTRSRDEDREMMAALGNMKDLKQILLKLAKDMIAAKATQWSFAKGELDDEGWELVEVAQGNEAWILVEVQKPREGEVDKAIRGPDGSFTVADHKWIRM